MSDQQTPHSSSRRPVDVSSGPLVPPTGIGQAGTAVRAGVDEFKAQVRAGTEAVRDGLGAAAEQAKAQAADIARQAKERAYDLAEEQKQVGVDGLGSIARAVRNTADELEEAAPGIARYVHDAASGIDDVSKNLKKKSVDDLLGTVEHFARTQPVAFFGGAVLAGFVLARFIKSSAERRAMAQESDAGDPNVGRSHPLHLGTSRSTAGGKALDTTRPQADHGGPGGTQPVGGITGGPSTVAGGAASPRDSASSRG